uniref:LFRFamide-2 n=1 Tax=Charonia tritonis TaxID=1960912 RepID=A0A1S6JQ32_9CAEN|nr:LFRFamide-2 precursor [Charonia tritonis]
MELSQVTHAMVVVLFCLLVAAVWCEEQDQGSALDDLAPSQPQKRSIADLPSDDSAYPAVYVDDDDLDKRSSLFRFGKRGSLFRFGKKRSSLFRFGKRSSLFRFGKRGSLFRFGKRDGDLDDEWVMYPDVYIPDDGVKRTVKSFHWGRQTEE